MRGSKSTSTSTSTVQTGGGTYTRKPNPTITTFWLCWKFFEMVVYEFTTWGLYDTSPVGGCVVGCAFTEGNSLGH